MHIRATVLFVALIVADATLGHVDGAQISDDTNSNNNNNNGEGSGVGNLHRPTFDFQNNRLASFGRNSFIGVTASKLEEKNNQLLDRHFARHDRLDKIVNAQTWPFERVAEANAAVASQLASNNNELPTPVDRPTLRKQRTSTFFGDFGSPRLRAGLTNIFKKLSPNTDGVSSEPVNTQLQFAPCKRSRFKTGQINSIMVNQHPIVPGTKLAIVIGGQFKTPILPGSVIHLTGRFDFLKYELAVDICEEEKKHGFSCPLYPGYQDLHISLPVPEDLPDNMVINASIKGVDSDGFTIFCVDADEIVFDSNH
ncbi:hypothetical protein BDF19DRAFT_411437 [Syncephalis fuscata]|nr:hypothetical protein BDF19DRAFT_411437 [Syncephalis fuscata]